MDIKDGFLGAVGDTPLIRLDCVSDETGCEILGKAEFLNPGGSVKDRAALYIVTDAEEKGLIAPGGTVVEGTAGNTGIGLVHICNVRGYQCIIYMPDNQSQEKVELLRTLGAEVRVVPTVPYRDEMNYQKQAGRFAATLENAIWANQFDNVANRRAHYETTGPEVWRQTDGTVDAFVASTGTGGTLAGVSRYLKEQSKDVKIVLADPAGSALYNYVKKGELETTEGPSLGEGIGSTRLTDNLADTEIDDAITIADPECVAMVYRLLYEDGLFMGGSTGVNVAAATRVAREMGPGHTIVTILADGGGKYMSRLFNRRWLAARGLTAP
jgi:cysteine synthase A